MNEVEQLEFDLGELEGDSESDREFIETLTGYYTTARHVALRALSNIHDAEDAVQDAFIKAWNAREKFRGDSTEETWLHRIVHNASLTELKRRVRRSSDSTDEMRVNGGDDPTERNIRFSPEAVVDNSLIIEELLEKARGVLPQKQFEVMVRRASGMSFEEIADDLNMEIGTARVNMHRAKKRMQAVLRLMDSQIDDEQ